MKKLFILTIIALLASGITVKAQTEKGKWFVAGSNRLELNVGGQKDKIDGDIDESSKQSYFDFDFQPRAGYMFIDNLAAGLFMDVDIYSSKFKDGNGYEVKGATFILGPFARYYIHVCDKLIPFAEAQVGFGIDNYKDTYNSGSDWSKYNETVFSYRIGGGATYFFNEMVGLDAFLGFNHESYKHKGDEGEASRSDHYESVIYNEFLMQLGIVVMLDCSKK
jgi:hypothetical protein